MINNIAAANTLENKFEKILLLSPVEEQKVEGGLRTQGYYKNSYEDKPLVSIITVVFNSAAHLEETIQNVISQTYDNVEYVIIDGGSTDGTLDIIKKYQDRIDYWVSEKDNGIYDAMNKGIQTVSGKWINFMNAGDTFYHVDVLRSLYENSFYQEKLIYGNINAQSLEKGINIKIGRVMDANDIYMRMPTCHQAIFNSAEAFKEIGYYDTEYKIIADYEWFVRFYKKYGDKGLLYVDEIIANYLMEGFATQNTLLSAKEHLKLRLNHFPSLNRRTEVLKYYLRYSRAIIVKFVKESMLYKKLIQYKYKN